MIRYFLPATVFFLISVVLLTLPGSAFPEENWMGDLQVDKIVHIGMFGILTFLLCWGFWKKRVTCIVARYFSEAAQEWPSKKY